MFFFPPKQTLMSVRTSGCVLMATASIQKAPSSASATRDTSAHRKAATAKAWIIQQTVYFNTVQVEPICNYLSPKTHFTDKNNQRWTVQIKCDWVQIGFDQFINSAHTCFHHIPTLFLFPSLQISMSVRGHRTVRGAAVSTVWAHITASARRATHWWEAGGAKVSLFNTLWSDLYQKTGCCLSFC